MKMFVVLAVLVAGVAAHHHHHHHKCPHKRDTCMIEKADFPGHDIKHYPGTGNAVECYKKCVATAKCKSFTYNTKDKKCWVKHTEYNVKGSAPPHCLKPNNIAVSGNIKCFKDKKIEVERCTFIKHKANVCIHPLGGAYKSKPNTQIVTYVTCNQRRLFFCATKSNQIRHMGDELCVVADAKSVYRLQTCKGAANEKYSFPATEIKGSGKCWTHTNNGGNNAAVKAGACKGAYNPSTTFIHPVASTGAKLDALTKAVKAKRTAAAAAGKAAAAKTAAHKAKLKALADANAKLAAAKKAADAAKAAHAKADATKKAADAACAKAKTNHTTTKAAETKANAALAAAKKAQAAAAKASASAKTAEAGAKTKKTAADSAFKTAETRHKGLKAILG